MSRSAEDGRAPGAALQLLRVLCERRETGTLELDSLGGSRRLQIVDGAFALTAAHPLAALSRGSAEQRSLAARRLAESLLDQPTRSARFDPTLPRKPPAEGGRIAIDQVLRWCARLSADAGWPRRLLPAQDDPLLAVEKPPLASDAEGWTPEELWILERLRQPMTLRELLASSPIAAAALRSNLAGLMLAGWVRRAAAPAIPEGGPGDLTQRLRDRIAASLAERPLDLSDEAYRERVAALLARAGGSDHYELLDLRPDAGAAELAVAFEELGRLVHPSNADVYRLEERRGALEYLFERACDAYRTLSDSDARIVHDRRHEIASPVGTQSEGERRFEAATLARRNFRRALDDEAIGDVHSALQMLEQVVRLDPRAEYWSALARLQSQNPAWLTRAIESLKSALELDPQSPQVRYELALLLERRGDLDHARVLFQSAAAGTPPHAAAREALERLGRPRPGEGGPGLLDKLFGRS